MKKNNKLLWSALTLVLALASIAAIMAQSKEMSVRDLIYSIGHADPAWMLPALICMFGFIFLESEAYWQLLRHTGYSKKRTDTLVYSAADIYCAAITPSASGGQPVCAWFMKRDQIPAGVITAVLLLYLIMHSLATITLGFAALFIKPSVFLHFSIWSKLLILAGYIALFCVTAFFFLLLRMHQRLYSWGCIFFDWLHKKGWLKDPKKWKKKLKKVIDDYSSCVSLFRGSRHIRIIIYALNLLQRFSQTLVSPLVYMAHGGNAENFRSVFVMQCFATVGSNCVPIPGGMGVADYLLFDGFSELLSRDAAVRLELLSRGMSFYMLVFISLVIMLLGYLARRKVYLTVLKKR